MTGDLFVPITVFLVQVAVLGAFYVGGLLRVRNDDEGPAWLRLYLDPRLKVTVYYLFAPEGRDRRLVGSLLIAPLGAPSAGLLTCHWTPAAGEPCVWYATLEEHAKARVLSDLWP